MFCKYCGKELKDDSVFCKYCGKSINKPKEEKQPIKLPSGKMIAVPVVIIVVGILILSFYKIKKDWIKNDETMPFNFSNSEGEQVELADQSTDEELEQSYSGNFSDERTDELTKVAIIDEEPDFTPDEEDKSIPQATDFTELVSGVGTVKVADDFLSAVQGNDFIPEIGKNYTISNLKSYQTETENYKYEGSEFSKLSIHGEELYAIRMYFVSDFDEGMDELFIFAFDDQGGLEIKFEIDGWFRRGCSTNKEGVVVDSGSYGARSHGSTIYAPDQSLSYKKISDMTVNCYEYPFYSYDDSGHLESVGALNDTMMEAAQGNEAAADIEYYQEIINEKTYYYYLASEGSKLEQDTVDYIDSIAKSHDFVFDGKAAADDARESYEKELGVYEACKNTKETKWKVMESFDTDKSDEQEDEELIFPNSSEEIIDPDDIKELSDEDLRYAINEIYARNGYIFKDEQLRNHFKQYDWYEESVKPEDFSSDMFNEVERKNIDVMKEERDSRG